MVLYASGLKATSVEAYGKATKKKNFYVLDVISTQALYIYVISLHITSSNFPPLDIYNVLTDCLWLMLISVNTCVNYIILPYR